MAVNAIDLCQKADYPIILGESLKDSSNPKGQSIHIRYNWKPKLPNNRQQVGHLSQAVDTINGTYKLILKNKEEQKRYTYEGHAPRSDDEDGTCNSFALIFDEARSAFVLETISSSLDFNAVSATDQKDRELQQHPQLPTKRINQSQSSHHYKLSSSSESEQDDERPSDDPYDFRHFLSQAREHTEQSFAAGNATPGHRTNVPGNRTPLGGVSSPIPGAARFHGPGTANTPQSRPATTSTTVQKKKRPEEHRSTPRSHPTKANTSRKTGASLSNERISSSDSDDEMDDTITVSRLPHNHRQLLTQQTRDGSPRIVLDDPSGLEIDMGSPPPEFNVKRSHHHINRDAFRSHTGTPRLGHNRPAADGHSLPSSPAPEVKTSQSSMTHSQIQNSHIPDRDGDGDVVMSATSDADVEEFALGSPRADTRGGAAGGSGSGRIHSRHQTDTPKELEMEDDDEEEDDLAAELAAALEEEDSKASGAGGGVGLGLGILGAPSQLNDDEESEVSEEE